MNYIAILLISIGLIGCKMGPTYHTPETPMPPYYSEDREGETFEIEDEDLVAWWRIFNDPYLDSLLEEAIAGNFDYRIALAQVVQARSEYWVQVTLLFPEVDFDFQASRYRTSSSFASSKLTPGLPHIQNFFQTGFDVIWQLDLFGKQQSAAAAAYDAWEATDAEARAIKIVMLTEVANTYAAICSFQEKVGIARELVQLDEELVELSAVRFDAGLTNEQEVQVNKATLEADRANLLVVETGLKLNIYSLATLLGRQPETLLDDFCVQRPIPYASGRVPAGLPSDLLRRRPDIRNAERNLAAATEQIGVAVGDLFPQVSLTGSSSSFAANPLQGANIGYTSDTASKLFDSASRIWGVGGLVVFPVFDFGRRLAVVDVEKALCQQAYLAYQKTVIAALQEVEQALVAYFNDEKRAHDLTREMEAYHRVLELTYDEFQAGLADYTQVVQAKEAWLVAVNNLTQAQQLVTMDLIAVYKSMGGDW